MTLVYKESAIEAVKKYGVGSFDFDDYTPEQAERFVIGLLEDLPDAEQQMIDKALKSLDAEVEDERAIYNEYDDETAFSAMMGLIRAMEILKRIRDGKNERNETD